MKQSLFFILLTLIGIKVVAQNVGINSTNATPDASAMLDVNSTNTGLLIPRVPLTGTTDITTITTAATSLLVYNTATITDVTPGYYYWNGTAWIRMLEGGTNDFWKTTGNAGTTVGTNFIGTTDAQDFAIYTNNTEKVRVTQNGNVGIGTATPNASAKIDISATDKGILIPQVTLTGTQDAITVTSPTNSLMAYNPGGGGLPVGYYYNKGTPASPVWVKITGDCIVWSTNVAGNYNLKTIVDAARTNGVLDPGVYDCVLRTSNGAHWSGRSFKLNANFYIGNPTYSHQIYDVVDVTAWTSGCWTGGLTAFTASTGAFSFSPGVCVQTITLTCPCQPR